MGFNLVTLAITIRTDDAPRLRSYLPLMGKEFSAVCREVACHWPDRVCTTCSMQETCGWNLVFGQKLTSDPAALKRHQKPPLPFVFSFPSSIDVAGTSEEIICRLVVIGQAIPHLGLLLEGFADLLAGASTPAPAEIKRIASLDYQGSVQGSSDDGVSVRPGNMVPENLVITSTDGLLACTILFSSELNIRLLSPLRLLEDGRPLARFEFRTFARSVMRRVSSLAFYYGESEFDCDFKELSRQVDDVICTKDFFGYTNTKNRKTSGITGYGSFLGDFSCLMPFILIGSYVHVGKGASFGLGAYELVTDAGTWL